MTDAKEHERRVIGSVLANNELALEMIAGVAPEMFAEYRPHAKAVRRLTDEGITIDDFTLRDELVRMGVFSADTGFAAVAELTSYAEGRKAFINSLTAIRAAHMKRSLAYMGESLASAARDVASDAAELMDVAEEKLLQLRAGIETASESHIKTSIDPLLARMKLDRERTGDLLGLPTGLASLDALTRGMQPGQVIIVGARSGVGKSSAMLGTVRAVCEQGVPVRVFSLEMSRDEILQRLIAAVSNVPFPRVRDPKWATDTDMMRITEAARTIQGWPLHVTDDGTMSIEELSANARLAVRRDRVGLIAVDYAQLVSASGKDERLRVANVSRGLARLAKSEKVPVLLLSQLSRSDKSTPNRRPMMADLRESGQLENDAHVIVLLHREWDEETVRLSTEGELIIAKQRSGETGSIPVTFNRRSLLFQEPSRAVAKPAQPMSVAL